MRKSIYLIIFIVVMFIVTNLLYSFSEVRFLVPVSTSWFAHLLNLLLVALITVGVGYLFKTDMVKMSKVEVNKKMFIDALMIGLVLFVLRLAYDVAFYAKAGVEFSFVYSFVDIIRIYFTNLFVDLKEFLIFVFIPILLLKRFMKLQKSEYKLYGVLIPIILFSVTVQSLVSNDIYSIIRVLMNISVFTAVYSYLTVKYDNIWAPLLFIDVYLVLFMIKIGVLLPVIF